MAALERLFLAATKASLIVSLIAAVLSLTGPLFRKRYASGWRYWAWLLLAVRLLLPLELSFPRPVVALPAPNRQVVITRQAAPATCEDSQTGQNLSGEVSPAEDAGGPSGVAAGSAPLEQSFPAEPVPRTKRYAFSLLDGAAVLWLAGAAAFLLWHGINWLCYSRRTLRWNRLCKDPEICRRFDAMKKKLAIPPAVALYENPRVGGPMLMGLLHPSVLMPAKEMDKQDLDMIFCHELTHCKRRDLWYKLLLLLARCLHWWNPVMLLFCREAENDLELTCDERTVARLGDGCRQDYCQAILRVAKQPKGRRLALSTGMSSSACALRWRFAAVLEHPARQGTLLLVLAAGLLTFCGVTTAWVREEAHPAPSPAPAVIDARPETNPLPPVTGPDESGCFPAIPAADFERWVDYGEADAQAPDTPPSAFLKTKRCTDYLARQFPEIDDWQVLYEHDGYLLQENLYDPYRYQWRDQYLPRRQVVLATGQSDRFDRVIVEERDGYSVEPASFKNTSYRPREEPVFSVHTGWESELALGDFGDAAPVFPSASKSLWFPQRQRAVLLESSGGLFPIVWTAEAPPPSLYTRVAVENDFALGAGMEGDQIIFATLAADRSGWEAYYYDAESRSLTLFEGCREGSPQYLPLDGAVLGLQMENRLNLYDLAGENPCIPFATIGGMGHGLTDEAVYIPLPAVTDRDHPSRHCFLYYTYSENQWRICTFDTGGTVLSDFSTGLPARSTTLGAVHCAGGLVYFTYLGDGRAHYCVDARPEQDHILQRY